MGCEKFDFSEALSSIKCGQVVSLTLDGKERRYYLNGDNQIVCCPDGKEWLKYIVKKFHIDSIMSNEWELVD